VEKIHEPADKKWDFLDHFFGFFFIVTFQAAFAYAAINKFGYLL
jgi:hypothetical protein